jgi:hypothetical protein
MQIICAIWALLRFFVTTNDSSANMEFSSCERLVAFRQCREAIHLFAELRKQPDQWFWALRSITGEDPVPAPARGKVREVIAAWLEWASRNGF